MQTTTRGKRRRQGRRAVSSRSDAAGRGDIGADFLCFALKVVIEVDGGQHDEASEYDARRTRFIESEGYRVLRFWNNDVLGNTDGVIQAIANSLSLREHRVNSAPHCLGHAGGMAGPKLEGGAKRRKGEGDQLS